MENIKQQHEFKCPACNANDIEVRAWVKLNATSDFLNYNHACNSCEDVDH